MIDLMKLNSRDLRDTEALGLKYAKELLLSLHVTKMGNDGHEWVFRDRDNRWVKGAYEGGDKRAATRAALRWLGKGEWT